MINRRSILLTAAAVIGFSALAAGIACMALEIPAAGVPLIVVFLASSFCFLERNCAHWQPRLILTTTPPPDHVTIPVVQLKPENPQPE
jgi:hypothetical protein